MREIKFRVWDRENKRMTDSFTIEDYVSDQDSEWGGNQFKYFGIPVIEDNDIMQYTGLKDKNNKEIYEGDVVYYTAGEYCQGFWEYSGQLVIKDFIADTFALGEYELITVVGNIYENPELLKEIK